MAEEHFEEYRTVKHGFLLVLLANKIDGCQNRTADFRPNEIDAH